MQNSSTARTVAMPRRSGRQGHRWQTLPILLLLTFSLAATTWAQPTAGTSSGPAVFGTIQTTLGLTGTVATSGALKIEFVRDQSVTVNGNAVPAGLVSSGFAAFSATSSSTTGLTTGEIPLLDGEVQGFVKSLEDAGVPVSAIHNHVVAATPEIIFVHWDFGGDLTAFATSLRSAIDASGITLTAVQGAAADAAVSQQITSILGSTAVVTAFNGITEITVNRSEQFVSCSSAVSGAVTGGATDNGTAASNACLLAAQQTPGTTSSGAMTLLPELGPQHQVVIQINGSNSITSAEFALLATEVNPVVKQLGDSGFNVTAVHNHTLNESPRLFFVHASMQGDISTALPVIQQVITITQASSGTSTTSGATPGTGGAGSGGTGIGSVGTGTGGAGTGTMPAPTSTSGQQKGTRK